MVAIVLPEPIDVAPDRLCTIIELIVASIKSIITEDLVPLLPNLRIVLKTVYELISHLCACSVWVIVDGGSG